METLISNSCGLDVHQASITACIMHQGNGKQVNTFGTTTSELERLRDWLVEHNITHVAMESSSM